MPAVETAPPRPARARLLIYTFPAVMDMVVGIVFFVNPVRAARMGADHFTSAAFAAVWGVVYMASCAAVGRLVTPRNASRLLRLAAGIFLLDCLLFVLLPSLGGMYAAVALSGVACALFFAPFQVFMKQVDTGGGKPVAYSAGVYAFAWSSGMAAGPLVSGYLMELGAPAEGGEPMGWMYCYAVAAAGSLFTGVGVWLLKHYAESAPAAGPAPEAPAAAGPAPEAPVAAGAYRRFPDLAWLGWLGAGCGVLVWTVIRLMFPKHGLDLALEESTRGNVIFLLLLMQGLTGLALHRSRRWMYRPWGVLGFGLCGLAGCLLYAAGSAPAHFYLAALAFGVYAGGFFFYLVFHSLTHPSRSGRYVAVNEVVVGGGQVAAPVLFGPLADAFGFGAVMVVGAGLILATVCVQAVAHRRRPPPAATV
jgi:MFS family permease